jgi:hypothetical protein
MILHNDIHVACDCYKSDMYDRFPVKYVIGIRCNKCNVNVRVIPFAPSKGHRDATYLLDRIGRRV